MISTIGDFRERGPMLNLPFTRTPQERAVEGLERKRKQEEAIKEKAGQVVDAVRGTGQVVYPNDNASQTAENAVTAFGQVFQNLSSISTINPQPTNITAIAPPWNHILKSLL